MTNKTKWAIALYMRRTKKRIRMTVLTVQRSRTQTLKYIYMQHHPVTLSAAPPARMQLSTSRKRLRVGVQRR